MPLSDNHVPTLPLVEARLRRAPVNMKKRSVLFVCMGNICRSPTAEGVLREKLRKAGLANMVTVASAGTHASHVGSPPDGRAQSVAAKRGYDLSRQRARRVGDADFGSFDHVLAMDRDNLATLEERCPPEHAGKIGLLMGFARRHAIQEIPDPYYGGQAGFDVVIDYIEDACDGLIESVLARPA